ncbi:MAG: 4-alpha-glucanotransferase [Candidatus Eisenbacteria bacterium]|nr:4-alpha-glucanotransferase [Candidatus Eisenbacteria bacterium]
MPRRASGILLHLTSLPSPFGIGDLGPEAHRFVDELARAGQSLWQVLPLYPTDPAHGNSPYSSVSTFAGSPLLLSPEILIEEGWLDRADLPPATHLPVERVAYAAVEEYKRPLFRLAYERLGSSPLAGEFERFRERECGWLDSFAAFMSFKQHFGGRAWTDWPVEARDRRPEAMQALTKELRGEISYQAFLQFLFARQWDALRAHCRERGVQIIGDLPIYVDHDSAEVWSRPELFLLGDDRRPRVVSGVPPDYFSPTGQRWGNPLYDWNAMRAGGFDWWMRRIERAFDLFDRIRIDHFRGLVAYWEIPAWEQTAVNGRWVEVPVDAFFDTLLRRFPALPIIAEDLGLITADVREIVRRYDIPGMKVLLFAFNEESPMHPYLPHTYERRSVVYTGTHDNNTALGWFEREARAEDRERLARYLGVELHAGNVHWELARAAMRSVADDCVIPVQDLLGLGEEARMNRPSGGEGNWEWRLAPGSLTAGHWGRLHELARTYGRS